MTPTPTEIADSLLPCPFCGKADPRVYDGEGEIELDPMQWQIVCDVNNGGCGGSAKWSFTQAEAIAAWNRRATSRDHRAAAEEIENAITAPLDLRGDKYLFGDEIMSLLKDRAEEVAAILSRRFPASPKPELAKEFDALAEKALAGRDAHYCERAAKAEIALLSHVLKHRTEISRALGGAVGDRYAEGYAAARAKAAKIVDGEIYQEYYRRWPQFGTGNVRNDSYNARLCDALATAILALKPQGGEE